MNKDSPSENTGSDAKPSTVSEASDQAKRTDGDVIDHGARPDDVQGEDSETTAEADARAGVAGEAPPDPSAEDLAGDAAAAQAEDAELDVAIDALHDRAGKAEEAEPSLIPAQLVEIKTCETQPQASIVHSDEQGRIRRLERMAVGTTYQFSIDQDQHLYVVACDDEYHAEIVKDAEAENDRG